MVQAGDELASLYSPDLVVTVQNLLDAQRSQQPGPAARSRATRLRLWGIDDDQIDEILQDRQGQHAPEDPLADRAGTSIKKYVSEGQYVEEGTPLYDVVDLSTVWIQAQVYEDDMAFLPTGHFSNGRRAGADQLAVTRHDAGLSRREVSPAR